MVEEAFWQIYGKRYIYQVLKLYDDHKHNQKWTDIVTRAIVFYKDSSTGKWSVMIKEFTHSFEMARTLDNIFKNLKNIEDLTNEKQSIAVKARNNFLGDFKNIEQFLSEHSIKDEEGKPSDKRSVAYIIPDKKKKETNPKKSNKTTKQCKKQ